MTELESIERAIREAKRDWRLVDVWHSIRPLERTIFGIPIMLDPSMPPNEIKLVADCGCVVTLINIGRDE